MRNLIETLLVYNDNECLFFRFHILAISESFDCYLGKWRTTQRSYITKVLPYHLKGTILHQFWWSELHLALTKYCGFSYPASSHCIQNWGVTDGKADICYDYHFRDWTIYSTISNISLKRQLMLASKKLPKTKSITKTCTRSWGYLQNVLAGCAYRRYYQYLRWNASWIKYMVKFGIEN